MGGLLRAAAPSQLHFVQQLRVAAPSIRFVPWAALASCWPLPQQLLPVSAAGGGRRRCSQRGSQWRLKVSECCRKVSTSSVCCADSCPPFVACATSPSGRRESFLKGKPIAAHGQQVLNLGDALALPLGELSPQVTERARTLTKSRDPEKGRGLAYS